ncbi:MAG: serine hydrolase [Nitrospirae bacterium]|nr:serine hydrolase [Nitrospirota bacterium]
MGTGKLSKAVVAIVILLMSVFCYSPISSADISAGCLHSTGIQNDGTLWAWGWNASGQLGDGTTNPIGVPEQIGKSTSWLSVSAGCGHTMGIRYDGTLWAWGGNSSGQLGDGTVIDRLTPIQIGTSTNWVKVSAGSLHTVGIQNDGTLWAWGGNSSGQLGDGTTTHKYSPVQIGTSTNWAKVSAGSLHTAGVQNDGTLWVWGGNSFGQLGIGTYTNSNLPVQITAYTNWSSVLAGVSSTLGIQNDGTLWAWGDNLFGQLAKDQSVAKTNIVTSASQISNTYASKGFVGQQPFQQTGMALLAQAGQPLYSYALYGWGRNKEGQIGDNTTSNGYSLKQIGTATNWSNIAGGLYHTLGVKNDGTLWAWGTDSSGQLGDNTTTGNSQNLPVQAGTSAKWMVNNDPEARKAANAMINELYNKYISYFGAKSGSVTTLATAAGTYYVQTCTNGTGLLAWTDGYMYYSNGSGWNCFGISWKDIVTASAKINEVYSQYISYFGTKFEGVTRGTASGGAYYFQWFTNGTALVAWPDGYIYYWNGSSWNNMWIVWNPNANAVFTCPAPSAVADTLTSSQAAQIQAMITGRTDNASYDNVPGMVMGIKRGNNTAWYGKAGYSDLTNKTPIQYTDKFRVGSVSKTFTATVVLQLAQEGKLLLSDTLAKWLPNLATVLTNYDLNAITITNLLTHTTGIHTYTDFSDPIFQGTVANPYRVWQSSEVMSVINSHSPDFTPGTNWVYSNSNYYLLGLIIQAVTGNPYEQEVKTRILDVLGMTSSEVVSPGNPYISGSYAHGYSTYNNISSSKLEDVSIGDPSYPFSAGSVISTIPDLLKWINALYYGTLLNSTYHQLQMTFINLDDFGQGSYKYGMGFMVEEDYFIGGHRGQIFGYDCSIQHYIPYDYDMAVCVNRSLFDDGVQYNSTNALILFDTLSVLTPSTAKPLMKRPEVKRPAVRTPLTEY